MRASGIRTLAFRQSRRPSRRSVVYCAGNEHRRRTKDGTATAQSSSSLAAAPQQQGVPESEQALSCLSKQPAAAANN